ncbi:MetQ/NlpA family ABC transporter substrate-binding protein [Kineococcus sp. SYSU DK018]|uniref:MetQ/NlpA family ABC transporter substrate-binding protein n=1 Tax=Kineococcus sp. SYSU DK018 TaxID=3383139 RepID=UPI003D7CCFD7
MSSATPPALPDKPQRSKLPILIGAAVVVVVAVVIALVVRNTGEDTTTTAAGETVRIGVTDQAEPYWNTYVDLAQERLGVDVELVNFSDYSLPNPALSQGEVDLNQFQHTQYLANYNVTAGDDLQPVGSTAVYPLPLYSTEHDDPSQFPQGAKIAIPDDAINEARALLVLQDAGLLTLAGGGSAFSTVADVETSTVEVVPLDASQTAGALQSGSVAGAVVNNNYATSAGLPVDAVVHQDDPESESAVPYVNLFVSRAEDTGNQTYLDLAELIHDPAVQEEFVKSYPQAVVRDVDAATLQEQLVDVEEDARAAQG